MHLPCPHCQNPVSLQDAQAGQDVACPTCGSTFRVEGAATVAYKPLKGQTIGKFELIEAVGVGAFGTVYRARDPELDRTVALKVPRAGSLVAHQEMDRFLREARSVARLRHPSIVSVHEVGQANSVPYLVSDFVEGITLADLITARRPGFRETAELIAQVADALQYAHEHGVVHRDVKPSNIMLEQGDDLRSGVRSSVNKVPKPHSPVRIPYLPKLMDFGLAKRDVGEVTMTMDGQLLGTPAYMSPEQARGEAHQVDGRSDVYSLGVILYQLLVGELPFRGNTRMLTHQVLHEEPRPPRKLNDSIPRDLETICLKAMAKEASRRYQAAVDFADDLRRYQRGEAIEARPIRRWERMWRWARRQPAVAGLLVASTVAVLALIGLAVFRLHFMRMQDALEKATTAQHAEEVARRAEAAALGEAQVNLYIHQIALAERAWQASNLRPARQMLEHCPRELRGWEWHYLQRLCHADQLTVTGNPNGMMGVAVSPDSKHVVAGLFDSQNTVGIWDLATGHKVQTLSGHTSWIDSAAYSPDGRLIATASRDSTVRVWEAASGRELFKLEGHAGRVSCVQFSRDGKQLASCGQDRTIRIWDPADGKERLMLRGHTDHVNSVAFHKDGQRVASGSRDRTVRIWDLATGGVVRTISGHSGEIMSVAYSPDGERLASGASDQTVRVWQADSGQEKAILLGHTSAVAAVAFSPDGRRLAGASRAIKVWDAASGEGLFTLKGHTKDILSLAFDPSGARLVSVGEDGALKVWDALANPEVRALLGHTKQIDALAFSPDGRHVASASEDGTLRIWDALMGQEIRQLQKGLRSVTSVAYSPDGKRLVACSDGDLTVWDAVTGMEVFTIEDVGRFALYMKDGQSLVVAGYRAVNILNAADGRRVGPPRQTPYVISCLAVSPTGTHVACGCEELLGVWDLTRDQERPGLSASLNTQTIHSVAFNGDGTRVACTTGGYAQGAPEVRVFEVKPVDASAEGDSQSPQELPAVTTLRGHDAEVFELVYTGDGQRLITASDDQTVRLWEAKTGREVLTLRGHTAGLTALAVSADQRRIASAGRDNRIMIWDANPLKPGVAEK